MNKCFESDNIAANNEAAFVEKTLCPTTWGFVESRIKPNWVKAQVAHRSLEASKRFVAVA